MSLIPLLLLVAAPGGFVQGSLPGGAMPEGVRLTADPNAPPALPTELPLVAEKKWALCVGAGAYTGGLAPLKYAAGDARAFAGALESNYGFDSSTVGLLTDESDAADARTRTAKPPTSANILGELRRLLADRRLDRGDLFVFYFSGHGVGTPTGDYLMPTDVPESEAAARGIPVRTVIESFAKAGLKNVLVIADACRSGAKNPFGRELQEIGRKANIAVLLGCAPGQRSYEYPRLGHGVFTHFLVRDLADRGLAESSTGALWASAVARKVAAQVKSYTESDYGDDPQIPAVWTEPTQDVLLAAYPAATEEMRASLAQFGTDFGAGRLDLPRYARLLSATGRSLAQGGRPEDAVGVLKTLDGLGQATWDDLFTLASALHADGRDNEIASLVQRAVNEPQPTDDSEGVILLGPVENVGTDRYRAALDATTDPATYGLEGARVRWALARIRLRVPESTLAAEMARYLPLFPKDSVSGRYVAAHIAFGERRWADAISLAEAAAAMPERLAMPQSTALAAELRLVRFRAAEALGDRPRIDAVIAEGEADATTRFPWVLQRLERLRLAGSPDFVAAVQEAATKTDSDQTFQELMMLLGPKAGTLLPQAERLAKDHPYSWRAAINVWLARMTAKRFDGLDTLPELAMKYAPDRGELVRVAFDRLDFLIERSRAVADDRSLDPIFVRTIQVRDDVVDEFSLEWESVKESPRAVMGMATALIRSQRVIQGDFFAKEFLWPYAKEQREFRQVLMTMTLCLALNAADEPLAREVFAMLERERLLGSRAIIRYALHQALLGNEKEAERIIALWPTLGQGEPNSWVKGYFAMTRALLAAKRGDKAAAKALVMDSGVMEHPAYLVAFLTRFLYEGEVGISTGLSNELSRHDAEFSDLSIAAYALLAKAYDPKTSTLERAVRAGFYQELAGYPEHPWVRAVGFEGASGIAAWTGDTEWEGALLGMGGAEAFAAKIGVDAKGRAKGTISVAATKIVWSLDAKVDDRGNLVGYILDAEGHRLAELAMKMPTKSGLQEMAQTGMPITAILLRAPWEGMRMTLWAKVPNGPPTPMSDRVQAPGGGSR